MIAFEVLMTPQPKERARTTTGHAYTPKRTASAEKLLQQVYHMCYTESARIQKPTPIAVRIAFIVPKPKKIPKDRIYPVTRPDLDNCTKLVLDSLNKHAYDDDDQVVGLFASKQYGDKPKVVIQINEVV